MDTVIVLTGDGRCRMNVYYLKALIHSLLAKFHVSLQLWMLDPNEISFIFHCVVDVAYISPESTRTLACYFPAGGQITESTEQLKVATVSIANHAKTS